jgi:hypothetical protein
MYSKTNILTMKADSDNETKLFELIFAAAGAIGLRDIFKSRREFKRDIDKDMALQDQTIRDLRTDVDKSNDMVHFLHGKLDEAAANHEREIRQLKEQYDIVIAKKDEIILLLREEVHVLREQLSKAS